MKQAIQREINNDIFDRMINNFNGRENDNIKNRIR